jgi:hypothetical protein
VNRRYSPEDSVGRRYWACPPRAASATSTAPAQHERALERLIRQGEREYFSGLNVGGFAEVSRFQSTFIEFFAPTGEEESRNSFGDTRVGFGGHVGFIFPVITNPVPNAPSVGPFVIEPFVQIEDPNKSTKFPFANGSFISAESNFEITTAVHFGPTFIIDPTNPAKTLWLFATIGGSFENEKFTINFIPTSSSESKTVTGLTVGFGGALTLPGVQVFDMPVALKAEWQHTFWQTGNFNMPAASPTSNFQFKGDDDKFQFGFTVLLRPSRHKHSPTFIAPYGVNR